MTADSVRIVFQAKIFLPDDTIGLSDGSTVPVDFFASLFAGASDTPTYQELVDIDGGTKGYIPFFDECKVEGILS
jgi:hypothetical protein